MAEDALWRLVLAGDVERVESALRLAPLVDGSLALHASCGVEPADFGERVAELLLEAGADPNLRSGDGMTSLHVAAAWGRDDIVKMLLNYGADPYLRDDDSNTPLDYANENHHSTVVETLLEYFEKYRDSPVEYSLILNKIFVDDGFYQSEYEVSAVDAVNEPCNDFSINNSIKKSVYVKQWCKNNEINHSVERENCSFDKYTTDKIDKTFSDYYSCCENINSLSSNNCSIESSLSGIRTLKITKNEENDAYSIIHKCVSIDSIDREKNIKQNEENPNNGTQINCNFPRSPVFPHVNYLDKTTLRSRKNNDLNENFEKQSIKDFQNTHEDNENVEKEFVESADEKTNFDQEVMQHLREDKNIFNSLENKNITSIAEEYKYEDVDAGVTLIEKRIHTNPLQSTNCSLIKSLRSSVSSSVFSLPKSVDYDTDGLRRELIHRGFTPGPITLTTKKIYLKTLHKLRKQQFVLKDTSVSRKKVYTVEMERTLQNADWNSDLSLFKILEDRIIKEFEVPKPRIVWREGTFKSSFTYLLLDPRITNNLPIRASQLDEQEIWRIFVDSIFYIGKGKRSRPYNHLYRAVNFSNKGIKTSQDKKIQIILDIWKEDLGVVCLHVFQNVIPVEAYTREAAMIEVMGLKNLKNIKPGSYYGVANSWSLKEKKLLGIYLLHKAMLIFMSEGERQLRPVDIC